MSKMSGAEAGSPAQHKVTIKSERGVCEKPLCEVNVLCVEYCVGADDTAWWGR